MQCRELSGDILKTYYLLSWVSTIAVTAGSLCSSQTDLKPGRQPAEADPGGNESTALSNTLILTNLHGWMLLFVRGEMSSIPWPDYCI